METVTCLITGKSSSEKHYWPVLGRKLCEYPMIAAQHAELVGDVCYSSDGPRLKAIAKQYGIRVIDEPKRERMMHVDALENALKVIKPRPDILVVMLGNVAVHQYGLVDRCILALEADEEASACVPVVRRVRYEPRLAIREGALVEEAEDFVAFEAGGWGCQKKEAVFLTHQLWALRVDRCFGATVGDAPWSFMGDKVLPLEVSCGGDVDCYADVVAAEKWLMQSAWTGDLTAYDTEEKHWSDYLA